MAFRLGFRYSLKVAAAGIVAVPVIEALDQRVALCASVDITVSSEQKAQFAKVATQFIKDVIEKEEATAGAEAAWEEEKSGCSFCQHFLKSPCKKPFSRWSKCVDKSKDAGLDYVTTCGEYTDALMACTSEHSPWFEAEQKKMEEENGKDKEK